MPGKLSAWCYRMATPPVLIAAVLIFILFIVLVLPEMAGKLTDLTGVGVSPDTSFIYSSADLYAMAEAYGAEGRAYYIRSRYTFDLIFPAVYLVFLAAVISRLFRFLPADDPKRFINLLPFGGAIFDLFENSAASLVMYRYPLLTPFAALLAPVFSFLKWVFIGLSFIGLFLGLALALVRFIRK